MGTRRRLVLGTLLGAVSAVPLGGCGLQAAAQKEVPTETAAPTAVSPYQIRVTMRPQDVQLGRDENVVIHVQMVTNQGRPVSGAVMSANVNYPSGPKTFKSDISTFPDGALDLAVPVAPATRGSNVRVEVVMTYQGQDYRATSGFTVR
jgi:hypothetical protein